MNVTRLVDAFVRKVNSGPRELALWEEVPRGLRYGPKVGMWTSWSIKSSNNSERIRDLEARLRLTLPRSYRDLLCRYSFPAFEIERMMLFSNTGRDLPWELEKRLFLDPHMSPALLAARYVQIGNPQFYSYDPVCLAIGDRAAEGRLVRLDHEALLQRDELRVVQEIAPTFASLMDDIVRAA